ncbi:hypothetical protein C8Q76DRAFT_692492 [Earliella scabrosa]|nr:hypothetical protein C8Q76DRAFT_692492 [Earliella scabrosa]
MRLQSLVYTVFTALSATQLAAAQTPQGSTPPTFETLFVGTFTPTDFFTIPNSTFGTRVHVVVTGGNLTDTSGNLVATLLPTAETGIISNSGVFFPEAILPFVWTADNKLAHFRVQGIGRIFDSNLNYLHVETDSEQYSELNNRFLLGNVSFPADGQGSATLTVFGSI